MPCSCVAATRALEAGLLLVAYHFGTAEDPMAQADYPLQCVEPDARTLLVLDLERNRVGKA